MADKYRKYAVSLVLVERNIKDGNIEELTTTVLEIVKARNHNEALGDVIQSSWKVNKDVSAYKVVVVI